MKYVNLGRSGLKVSRLCLGCMSYGEPERLPQPWSLDEKASRPLIRQALEAGINFFDTANTYSDGSSEEITGKALREMARRDEIVVATKTFFPWRNSPNTGFLSRKAIFQSIDDSLMRLGMDYVDLFQIHRFDYSTSVEETMKPEHLSTAISALDFSLSDAEITELEARYLPHPVDGIIPPLPDTPPSLTPPSAIQNY